MMPSQTRRDALAQFLRSRRERLDPAAFGIKTGGRRRAAGLRREEIADAAGISTTWYVFLEQGRDVNASAHALRALGRALRLSLPEQTYLFRLARPDLDWRHVAATDAQPSANLVTLLEGLAPHPAYVTNRYAQVVASNAPARLLLGAFGGVDASDPWTGNLIARLFLDPLWRARFVDWSTVARSAVAQFRLNTVTMAGDPVLAALVAMLTGASEEFGRLWSDHELAEPPVWRKTLRHPRAGDMTFDFASLQPGGPDSEFRVSVYTPADRTSRARLARLLGAATRPKASARSRAARNKDCADR
jgi:transcriptional regulator with XRE-family HTH domain